MTRGERDIDRLVARRIPIDGTAYTLTVDRRDAETVYIPLARRLADLAALPGRARRMVGIAGPPGAGKSATAAILAAAIAEVGSGRAPVVVPLDGFHYPNAYLRAHVGPDHAGIDRPLASLKGWHATFDAARAVDLLGRVRAGDEIALPVYSRETHDPVDGALSVGTDDRLVIVEGNWLYLDVDPWPAIRALFDVLIFVTAPRDILRAQVLERHLRGAADRETALAKIARVDAPNMDAVDPTERHAEIVIDGVRGALAIREPRRDKTDGAHW